MDKKGWLSMRATSLLIGGAALGGIVLMEAFLVLGAVFLFRAADREARIGALLTFLGACFAIGAVALPAALLADIYKHRSRKHAVDRIMCPSCGVDLGSRAVVRAQMGSFKAGASVRGFTRCSMCDKEFYVEL
jgi:hypothetical protein